MPDLRLEYTAEVIGLYTEDGNYDNACLKIWWAGLGMDYDDAEIEVPTGSLKLRQRLKVVVMPESQNDQS